MGDLHDHCDPFSHFFNVRLTRSKRHVAIESIEAGVAVGTDVHCRDQASHRHERDPATHQRHVRRWYDCAHVNAERKEFLLQKVGVGGVNFFWREARLGFTYRCTGSDREAVRSVDSIEV